MGRREEKKAQTRARLLDAAAAVFARKGLVAASLDEVAEEAGLTKGAVYSNFAGKDDLIDALLKERLDKPLGEIAAKVDPDAPVPEQAAQAEALFRAVWDRERDMFLLGLEFSIHRARNPDSVPMYRGDRDLQDAMAALMEQQAKERGLTLPLPATELAAGLFALGSGLDLMALNDPERVPEGLFAKFLTLIMGQATPA
ncbi:MAG TPA: TetR/AcrR family transcriptional regulator [Acidimicrobiales bacterium]|nr:TetR/AcrR family transcriptional regulator [Acidimicrobiales bacterium]